MPSKLVQVYQEVDGVFLNKRFDEDLVRSTLRYKPQRGDVFIVSYPKCGTTWMQHIIYNILADATVTENKLDYITRMPFLERQGADAAVYGPKPGALKTHLQYGKNPYSPDAKYIYITRNPYDCCVSFYYHTKNIPDYNFQNGTFDEFFEMFIEGKVDFGDYFDHLTSWFEHRNDPNILFLTYEDLKRDTKCWVIKIARFMGPEYSERLEQDESFLNQVLDRCSLDSMKNDINSIRRVPFEDISASFNLEGVNPRLHKGLKACNAFWKSPMTGNFVRKGIVGDWRNHFSPDQIERTKRKIEEKTNGRNIMSLWQAEDLP